jgi:hypothetical protein
MRSVKFVELVRFDPPDAVSQLENWQREHAAALAAVPADELETDIGRSLDGDFARVRVTEPHVARFQP